LEADAGLVIGAHLQRLGGQSGAGRRRRVRRTEAEPLSGRRSLAVTRILGAPPPAGGGPDGDQHGADAALGRIGNALVLMISPSTVTSAWN